MILVSELHELHPIYCYCPKGDTVTFASIKNLLVKTAKQAGVPVAFAFDEIKSEKSGDIIIEDCLIVYHPEHRHDYFNIVFRIRREGDTAYISKNEYGKSRLLSNTENIFDTNDFYNSTEHGAYEDKEREREKQYYLALHSIFSFLKC